MTARVSELAVRQDVAEPKIAQPPDEPTQMEYVYTKKFYAIHNALRVPGSHGACAPRPPRRRRQTQRSLRSGPYSTGTQA